MFLLFPLKKVLTKDDKKVQSVAKFGLAAIVLSILVGLGVMLALIIRWSDEITLFQAIFQPFGFLAFNSIDMKVYTYVYKMAYPKQNKLPAEGVELELPETDDSSDDPDGDDWEVHPRYDDDNVGVIQDFTLRGAAAFWDQHNKSSAEDDSTSSQDELDCELP